MTSQTPQQRANNILSVWEALEVLSPQKYQEDADGDPAKAPVLLEEGPLPWENGGERVKQGYKLFYHLTMGFINIRAASKALIDKYGDENTVEQLAPAFGDACITVVTLDQAGRLVDDDNAVSISAFAWGLPKALAGRISELSVWKTVEQSVHERFASFLSMKNHLGHNTPLTMQSLHRAYNDLMDTLKLPAGLLSNAKYAVKKVMPVTSEKLPQAPILNSFYLHDLARAKQAVADGTASDILWRYLGIKKPRERIDVLSNKEVLENVLAPHNIPFSRWPSPGRHPLVLLQQAAVNLAVANSDNHGMFAINGPPGTGKTTLLRDIIAAVLCQRAEAMARFDNPADAFKFTGARIKVGQGYFSLSRVDESLKGFEILIASSNNKAVENVTAELPAVGAIASDLGDFNYFNTLSDEISQRKTWGLISAVLGNADNRNKFWKKFWWDDDHGMGAYLLAVSKGQPKMIEILDPQTGRMIGERLPRIVEKHDAPLSHAEALQRWQQARANFEHALSKCKLELEKLEEIKQVANELKIWEQRLKLSMPLAQAIEDHERIKPGKLALFLRFHKARKWRQRRNDLLHCAELQKKVQAAHSYLGDHMIDGKFFSKNHREINLTSPWCDFRIQALRDEVFVAAVKLAKAFVDAAATPLRHNVGILQSLSRNSSLDSDARRHIQDLWTSFFLVVPSVSTTFASMSSMFEHLPQGALGWLLIDEAGQATPQAAVGGIMKAKRVILSGDPLQIEPVVTLPQQMTQRLRDHFGVKADAFTAPSASAQTLADAANTYFASFCTSDGDRDLGFPLLVHRRCADPMFSAANTIAYEGLMVSAKPPNGSRIRDCLGPSVWLDVKANAQNKWCPEEGEVVMELLTKLKHAAVPPDLYILSPFRDVAYNLSRMIKSRQLMNSWVTGDAHSWIKERVGTVHTAQGREAEAVILVLGAQMQAHAGARIWAGSTPNLLNVAVTRAKEALYVVGNLDKWQATKPFKVLAGRMSHCAVWGRELAEEQ